LNNQINLRRVLIYGEWYYVSSQIQLNQKPKFDLIQADQIKDLLASVDISR